MSPHANCSAYHAPAKFAGLRILRKRVCRRLLPPRSVPCSPTRRVVLGFTACVVRRQVLPDPATQRRPAAVEQRCLGCTAPWLHRWAAPQRPAAPDQRVTSAPIAGRSQAVRSSWHCCAPEGRARCRPNSRPELHDNRGK